MTETRDSNALAYSGRVLPFEVLARRGRRYGWWLYAERRIFAMKAYWTSILGFGVLTPIFYLIAMGMGLGALVDASAGGIAGVGYLQFVAPGLCVSSVVMEATAEMTFPVMAGFKWQRIYFGIQATPVTPTQMALGETLAVGLRMVAQALIFWLVLVAFGASSSPTSWLMVPIAALAALAFGTPLMAYSATLENEGFQFAFIQRFIVMPMFLFAGTFYPLESMPAALQWIGWISPMWHGTQLARVVSLGLAVPGWLVVVHIAFLVVFALAGLVVAVGNFERRLTR